MSTRCQITVEQNENIKIYKHCDGYPNGVLDVLLPCVQTFQKYRGWDPEYLTARILMAFAVDEEKDYQEYATSEHSFLRDTANKPRVTGFGLDSCWHGDIEFAYVVDKNFNINVHCFWGTDFDNREPNKENCICTIPPTCTLGDALATCKSITDGLSG